MTSLPRYAILKEQHILKLKSAYYPLFRVMEMQRICEVTATPADVQQHIGQEGANLSEKSNDKRIWLHNIKSAVRYGLFFIIQRRNFYGEVVIYF